MFRLLKGRIVIVLLVARFYTCDIGVVPLEKALNAINQTSVGAAQWIKMQVDKPQGCQLLGFMKHNFFFNHNGCRSEKKRTALIFSH